MRGTMFLRLGDAQATREELAAAWECSGFAWRLVAYRALAAMPSDLAQHSARVIRRATRACQSLGAGGRARSRAAASPPSGDIDAPARQKIIVISGNNGGGNRGDELMCQAACSFFREKLPDADIVTDTSVPGWQPLVHGVRVFSQVAYDPSRTLGQRFFKPLAKSLRVALLPTAQKYPALRPVLQHGREFLAELSDASALFFAGCGVLTDRYAGMLLAWRAMMLAAQARAIPVFVSGIGGGPLTNRWLRKVLERPLSGVEDITCRNWFHTRNVLVDLGIDPGRITMVPDDAVFYSPVSLDDARAWLKQNTRLDPGQRYVVMSLMHGGGISDDRLRDIARTVRDALPGIARLYMPLAPDDLAALRIAAADDPDAVIAPLASPAMTKAVFGGAWLALSARYHGCVFALAHAVPTVGIVADDYWKFKIDGVCSMFSVPGHWIDLRVAPIEQLQSMIATTAQRRDELAARVDAARDQLQPLAYYAHRKVVQRLIGSWSPRPAAPLIRHTQPV
jgi:polysaccharide pyruvyl transferase WcaK-like protein